MTSFPRDTHRDLEQKRQAKISCPRDRGNDSALVQIQHYRVEHVFLISTV